MSRRSCPSIGVASRLATVSAAALALGLGAAPSLAADAPGASQAVRLGAGEHADFSRVVLNMAPPAGWSARNVQGGVEVVLPGAVAAFDDKAVTTQRRAHRVASAHARPESGGAVLRLDFDCNCSAKVYALRGSMIVVDVSDGAPEAVMATTRAARQETRANGAASAGHADAAQAEPLAQEHHQGHGSDEHIAAQDAAERIEATAKPPVSPKDEMEAEVARAREMLLQQLQRAADEGFVRFREDPRAAQSEIHTADAPAAREGHNASPEPTPAHGAAHDEPHAPAPKGIDQAMSEKTAQGHSNRTLSDAADAPAPVADAHASHAPAHATEAGHTTAPAHGARAKPAMDARANEAVAEMPPVDEPDCPDETVLSPEFWLDERPFHEGLAAHRAAMFDGLNRVDAEAAREMAGFYLGHGLGAEAALMTEAFASNDPALAILADAGRIIDGLELPKESPFLRKTPCKGKTALWQAAALSQTDLQASAKAFRASGRSIARTPEPLRRLLGERIALATARTGDSEASSAILALLSRNLDEPTDGMRMANAELALHEGRIVAAQAEFDAILQGRGEYAVEAAIALASTLTDSIYAARAKKLGDTLDGIALQNRYGPKEEQIVRVLAELRSRYGDLRGALAALDDVIGRRADEPVALAFADLRLDLIATEVETVVTSRDLGLKGPKRLVAATEAVRALAGDPRSDAMRSTLARHLIDTHAPKVASLVADAPSAQRDRTLAELRAEALEQTALLEKVGTTASERHGDGGEDDHALQTGDFQIGAGAHGGPESNAAAAADGARQRLRSQALTNYAEGGPLPDALKPRGETNAHDQQGAPQMGDGAHMAGGHENGTALAADDAHSDIGSEVSTLKGLFDRQQGEHPPAPTSADEGRDLLDQIDAEINFFKEIADDG